MPQGPSTGDQGVSAAEIMRRQRQQRWTRLGAWAGLVVTVAVAATITVLLFPHHTAAVTETTVGGTLDLGGASSSDGNLQITVLSLGGNAQYSGPYVDVNIKVTNTGTQTNLVDLSDFALIDTNGDWDVQSAADVKATTEINQQQPGSPNFELAPGQTQSGEVLFNPPESAAAKVIFTFDGYVTAADGSIREIPQDIAGTWTTAQ